MITWLLFLLLNLMGLGASALGAYIIWRYPDGITIVLGLALIFVGLWEVVVWAWRTPPWRIPKEYRI